VASGTDFLLAVDTDTGRDLYLFAEDAISGSQWSHSGDAVWPV
jgi:hypothetical protein